MAGSWNHTVEKETGKLLAPRDLTGMLETSSRDVFEYAEEAYGMVWYLANSITAITGGADPQWWIETARQRYKEGLALSPGMAKEGVLEDPDSVVTRCPYSHEGDLCTQCGWSRFVAPLPPTSPVEESVFWPRNPLEGRPGLVQRLLAYEGKTFGYGYGRGDIIVFGSAHGDIEVPPGSWVNKHADGSISVEQDADGD